MKKIITFALTAAIIAATSTTAQATDKKKTASDNKTAALQLKNGQRDVGISPWGKDDEIGRLNLITPHSKAAILSRIKGGKTYDLSVDYYIGMPSWQAAGDPHYRMWMTHTPHGNTISDPLKLGTEMNSHVSYTGAAVSMYTHMGTHIDALNHFGLNGKIWNGFKASDHAGDQGWKKGGVEKMPPLIARGVMLDIAAYKGVKILPAGYRITKEDLIATAKKQAVTLEIGDIILIRTGRMHHYQNANKFMDNPPGLGLIAAKYLVEEKGAMVIGADNLSLESFPSELPDDYVPVHTYLLAQQGTPIIELAFLEDLSKDKVYEFAFIGTPLKFKGADAAPLRPIAIPLNK